MALFYSQTRRHMINRETYMSMHVLLNLLNKSRKRNKMQGLPSNLSLFVTSLTKDLKQFPIQSAQI